MVLAAPHSTAQTTYALPHRGRSMSRVATDQYVLGSAESNRSAICVCAFVSKVTPSIVACTACAVVVTGLRPPDLPPISEDMWDTLYKRRGRRSGSARAMLGSWAGVQ